MEFRILGALQVLDDGRELPLGSPKERELLAVLLLHAGTVVSRDRLIEELWGESPPPTAAKALNVHVSQLRKRLALNGHDPVATRAPGYALELEPDGLDAARFERLVTQARTRLAAGDGEAARSSLREALALWRGPALDGVELEAATRNEVARLEELRLAATMDRIDCDLALGLHEHVIGELEGLVSEHPLRERLRGQLMLALYRSGRQADALRYYRDARETLVGELGIEPSAPLQRLERAILNQDPSLELPAGVTRAVAPPPRPADAEAPARRSWVRDRRTAAVSVVVLVAAAVAAAVFLTRDHGTSRLGPDMTGLLDADSGRVIAKTPAPERLAAMAGGRGALWLAAADGTVSRVDLRHAGSIDRFPIGGSPVALTAAGYSVWVVDQDTRSVKLFDAATGRLVRRVRVGNGPSAIAAGAGALWVTNTIDGTLTRIDPARARAVRTIGVGGEPDGVAVGAGAVWVTSAATNTVVRVDPRTNDPVTSIQVGSGPGPVSVSADAVWVANLLDGTVSRIDPRRNAVSATIRVGPTVDALAARGDSVWAASASTGVVARIDPHRNEVTRRVAIGSPVFALAATSRGIGVATAAAPAKGRGGTLTMVGHQLKITLDPATWWSAIGWSLLATTNDGLVTYRRAAGAAGYQIVPDLARSLPLVAGGGRRYSFQLRSGLRYSSGRLVRAGDVRASIERLWRIGSFAVNALPPLGLLGESACKKRPRRCDLSRAIVTNDRSGTVTFRLSSPNPLFLRLLALPFYDVLPAGTAPRDGRPLPATGAYRIARVVRNRNLQVVRLELVRNERFHEWSRAAQPDGFVDRVVWRVDRNPQRSLWDVLAGRADYLVANGPPRRLGALETLHASQLHSEPMPVPWYVFLNTRIAPFDSLDARRALNFAVDREKVARLFGGPLAARPTCQVLPPGFPGYRPTCPYTLTPNASGTWRAPDLARARALVRRSRTLSTGVTVWFPNRSPEWRAAGRYVTHVLRALGYRARLVETLPPKPYGAYVADSRNRAQLGIAGWGPDVPAAGDFFRPLFSCAAFRAGSPENTNLSGFCDRSLDALMRRAASRELTDQEAAGRLWAAVDRRVVAEAPWVPLFTQRWIDVVSKRLRNYSVHPVLGDLMISQARVR